MSREPVSRQTSWRTGSVGSAGGFWLVTRRSDDVTDLHEDVTRQRVDGQDRLSETESRPEELERSEDEEEATR